MFHGGTVGGNAPARAYSLREAHGPLRDFPEVLPPSPTPDFSFSPSQLAGGCHSCHTVCRWILATAAAAAVWFEVSCVSCSQSEVRGRSVGADAVYIGKIVACSCICTVGGES